MVLRGKLACACGCVTHFEAIEEKHAGGSRWQIFGLSIAKATPKTPVAQPYEPFMAG